MPVNLLIAASFAASIPSPSTGEIWLGPVPLRAYGILMVAAMVLAGWLTLVRYRDFGGVSDVVVDVALWAIPFGIVGARLYHVVTTPHGFFGPDGDLSAVFRIWEGGMAIWGAIGFGAVGAVIGLRRAGQRIGPFADAVAPTLLFAQALGRFGNYFNQELFGSPTDLPWGLEIDAAHLPDGYVEGTLFHPTFLYEGLWNVSMGLLLIYMGRIHRFKAGQVMALYMVVYPIGRIIMETMRLDEARVIFGLRLNTWTSILVLVAGLVVYYVAGRVGAPEQISAEERAKYYEIAGRPVPEADQVSETTGDEDETPEADAEETQQDETATRKRNEADNGSGGSAKGENGQLGTP